MRKYRYFSNTYFKNIRKLGNSDKEIHFGYLHFDPYLE